MAKLRTRKHKVVLARSAGGDAGITFILVILGAFMFIPMYYVVIQSLKPLDELWMFPPRFYVTKPTFGNYADLFLLMNNRSRNAGYRSPQGDGLWCEPRSQLTGIRTVR